MELKRRISLGLAAVLALGACALAEEPADVQAQLDAANARIAELEAEVEKYRPYYEKNIVAEFGEGGIIWLEDADAQYQQAAAMYAQYGIPVDSYAAEIKQSIVESMVQEGVVKAKAEELGLSEISDETLAELTEEAANDFETYVQYYMSYFAQEGASDEENHQATVEGLNNAGISETSILQDRLDNYASEQLHDYVTKDLTVTDEEVQAKYQSLIESNKEEYTEDYAYNNARMSGDPIVWNPEGYRAVKHVLIKFTDEQAQQYSELESAKSDLEDELAALDEPKEEAAEGETAEAEEAPRTREEIQTDIGAIGTSLEALYAELLPKAQEVVDAFNNGTDFDALIEKYNEDPGMTRDPGATLGYAVSAESTYWDSAFTEGAMSIAGVGQISEPVRGQNGIHIIYYLSDITPGEVPFEDVQEAIRDLALEEKIETTYDEQVTAWVEAANAVYHMENFK